MVSFLMGFADAGMWLPLLLKRNEAEMQSLGFKLTAEDVYNVNNSSLKDAIVLFGGGCTAELISKNGLLLTNQHCGYSYIQRYSSLEKNYLHINNINIILELTKTGIIPVFINVLLRPTQLLQILFFQI